MDAIDKNALAYFKKVPITLIFTQPLCDQLAEIAKELGFTEVRVVDEKSKVTQAVSSLSVIIVDSSLWQAWQEFTQYPVCQIKNVNDAASNESWDGAVHIDGARSVAMTSKMMDLAYLLFSEYRQQQQKSAATA